MQFFFIILYYCFFFYCIYKDFHVFFFSSSSSLILRHQRVFICIVVSVLPFFFFINSILYASSSSSATSCWTTPCQSHQSEVTRARAPISAHFQTPSIRNNSGPIDSPQIEQGWRAFAFHDLHFFSETYFSALSTLSRCVRIIVYLCVCPLTNQTPVQNAKRRNPFRKKKTNVFIIDFVVKPSARRQLPH